MPTSPVVRWSGPGPRAPARGAPSLSPDARRRPPALRCQNNLAEPFAEHSIHRSRKPRSDFAVSLLTHRSTGSAPAMACSKQEEREDRRASWVSVRFRSLPLGRHRLPIWGRRDEHELLGGRIRRCGKRPSAFETAGAQRTGTGKCVRPLISAPGARPGGSPVTHSLSLRPIQNTCDIRIRRSPIPLYRLASPGRARNRAGRDGKKRKKRHTTHWAESLRSNHHALVCSFLRFRSSCPPPGCRLPSPPLPLPPATDLFVLSGQI